MTAEVPQHVGYIMDGNRRWARERGLPGYEGHMAGYAAFKEVLRATIQQGVKYVSVYAFSTENWSRPQVEVGKIMSLVLQALAKDMSLFTDNDVRFMLVGSREGLDRKLRQSLEKAEAETAHGTAGTLVLCFNYGGQQEIADACNKLVQAGVTDISPEMIAQNLYAPEVPPIDLLVRTSGEQRLSNFMLWRAAYSELLFLEKYWPDMTKDDVTGILEEYARRQRRFGG